MHVLLKNKHRIFLIILLLVAAFLRLYKIADYITFLGDEGRDVLVVYTILHGHLTLLGPTSSVGGFFLGPIYYYFMAPFLLLFNYDPVGPAVMVALFGILTVWFVYYIAKTFFNATAGIIAALLYTISPLVLTYSRSSWNPNLMPICTLTLLFILYQAVRKESLKLFLLTGFLYGIAMQLHYIEVFIGVVIGVYIFLSAGYLSNKKSVFSIIKKGIQQGILVFVGFLLGWSPFLAFEARHGFTNIKNIATFVFASKDAGAQAGFSFWNVGDIFLRVFGRLIIAMPSSDTAHFYSFWELFVWHMSGWILSVCCVASLAFFLWKKRQDKVVFLQYSLLLCWFFFGVVLFGFYHKAIYDYYLEFLFPLPFLFVGFLFSSLWIKKLWVKIMISALLGVVIVANILQWPFWIAPNRQVQQTEMIAKEVLHMAQGQPYNFALISGGNSDQAYRYFLTIWGHPPVTIENAAVDPQRKTVTSQLIVVCESLPCGPLGYSLWEIAGFGRADIAEKKHLIVVDIYKLVHYKGK